MLDRAALPPQIRGVTTKESPMFPIIRMAKDVIVAARQAPLDNLTDTHVLSLIHI